MKLPVRRVLKGGGVLLAFFLAAGFMLRWFEHYQVYHPSRSFIVNGSELGVPFEDVKFQSKNGPALNGWFFPRRDEAERPARVVLLCHGNGGNISHRLELCSALLDAGLAVFVFDYQGYGKSQGRPSEEGTYRDALAAHDWLLERGFEPKNILAFGESLGGAVACELVSRVQCGGLILVSTFTSIPDIGAELFPWLPVRLMAKIKYDTCRKLPKLKVPVLVMHSRADELIRFAHCEKNFAAIAAPKLLCELSGDHNDPLTDRESFLQGLRSFLDLISNAR